MAVTFGYQVNFQKHFPCILFDNFLLLFQFTVSQPDAGEMFKGMIIPWCKDCDSKALLQAVGVIGAVIMPHNLYIHSALVKVN